MSIVAVDEKQRREEIAEQFSAMLTRWRELLDEVEDGAFPGVVTADLDQTSPEGQFRQWIIGDHMQAKERVRLLEARLARVESRLNDIAPELR